MVMWENGEVKKENAEFRMQSAEGSLSRRGKVAGTEAGVPMEAATKGTRMTLIRKKPVFNEAQKIMKPRNREVINEVLERRRRRVLAENGCAQLYAFIRIYRLLYKVPASPGEERLGQVEKGPISAKFRVFPGNLFFLWGIASWRNQERAGL
jgi:hypothetical protein